MLDMQTEVLKRTITFNKDTKTYLVEFSVKEWHNTLKALRLYQKINKAMGNPVANVDILFARVNHFIDTNKWKDKTLQSMVFQPRYQQNNVDKLITED